MSAPSTRILIIDEMHPSIFPMLEELGVEAVYRPAIRPDEVPAALEGFEGLILRSKTRLTEQALQQAHQLKFVARAGAGVDNIDQEALQKRGIALVSASEGNRVAVGEHALGMLLALLRNIVRSDRQVRGKVWLREENRGEELTGKIVGIIGYGNMGQSFCRVLSGFDCRILIHDCYAPEKVTQPFVNSPLAKLQAEADVVSLHIPYLQANHQFANDAFFSGFRKPIWFMNTSRGEVVDQAALVQHLQQGTVKGAALDVLENEKLHTLTPEQQENFAYLAAAENVVLTPHIAGWTHESYVKINEVLAEKIKLLIGS